MSGGVPARWRPETLLWPSVLLMMIGVLTPALRLLLPVGIVLCLVSLVSRSRARTAARSDIPKRAVGHAIAARAPEPSPTRHTGMIVEPYAGRVAPTLPYKAREAFFNGSERKLYFALRRTVSERYVIFAKVRLLDLCEDVQLTAAFNKISQKHVDFVLCDRETFCPTVAIEVDGSSHWRRERQESDAFKDEFFGAIGVPLIRFRARPYFDPDEVSRRIDEALAA